MRANATIKQERELGTPKLWRMASLPRGITLLCFAAVYATMLILLLITVDLRAQDNSLPKAPAHTKPIVQGSDPASVSLAAYLERVRTENAGSQAAIGPE